MPLDPGNFRHRRSNRTVSLAGEVLVADGISQPPTGQLRNKRFVFLFAAGIALFLSALKRALLTRFCAPHLFLVFSETTLSIPELRPNFHGATDTGWWHVDWGLSELTPLNFTDKGGGLWGMRPRSRGPPLCLIRGRWQYHSIHLHQQANMRNFYRALLDRPSPIAGELLFHPGSPVIVCI